MLLRRKDRSSGLLHRTLETSPQTWYTLLRGKEKVRQSLKTPITFKIDISGIVVEPEQAGRGYQCHVEGLREHWSRGDTVDEAVGSLVRRLALEYQGANWRAEQLRTSERVGAS